MTRTIDSSADEPSDWIPTPVRRSPLFERSKFGDWPLAVLTVLIVFTPKAFAINGFFIPGYGPKSLAVAGTGVAMPQDRLSAAINPAGMTLVEPGLDASALMLHPQREGTVDCTGRRMRPRDLRSLQARILRCPWFRL